MTIEERLHEAMHEYADGVEPAPESWARIESRLEAPSVRRPPVRGLVVAGVALVTVLALMGALLATRDTGGGDGRVSTAPAKDMPSRILAITKTGQPVVLDSKTGRRVAGFDSSGYAEGTQIAVSPDGRDFYYVLGDRKKGCDAHLIDRLPAGPGGRPGDEIARGATDPTLSPDGRHLAYLRCIAGDDHAHEIVLRELASGEERSFAAPSATYFAGGLQFAPDSRHIALRLFDERRRADSVHEVDLLGGEQLPGRVLAIDSSVFWTGYLGSTDEYLGVFGYEVVIAPAFGGHRALFALPTGAATAVADLSGRHVLAIDGGREGGALYRWSEGDKSPTKVADGITAAAWIPDAPRAPAAPRPKQVVALTSKLDLVVMDASTGHVVRELDHDVSVRRGLSELAPTPDGKDVYFTSHLPPDPSGQCPGTVDTVMRVDVAGGVVGSWGSGRAVAISPDGRRLAIAGGTGRSGIGCGEDVASVQIRDSAAGSVRTIVGTTGAVFSLSWAPNSRDLAFQWDKGSSYAYVLDTVGGSSLNEARCVCEQSDATGWHGYLGDTGDFLGSYGPGAGSSQPNRVVALGPDGAIGRTLFSTRAPINDLRSDASGTHVLMTTDRGLYRWSEGESEPTKIAEAIVAAAWIPEWAPSTPIPPSKRVLAVIGGDHFGILNASDGSASYVPVLYTDVGGVSATGDGRTVVFAQIAGRGGCGSGNAISSQSEIDRLDLATGATEIVVGGSFSPAVSSKGLVAYGFWCEGNTLGFTDLATGQNYRSNPLGSRTTEASPGIDSVEPLGWSPDGTTLLYRLRLGGDPRWHYYDGRLWPAVRSADTDVTELAVGPATTGATFFDAHQFAIAEDTDTGARVRTYDTSNNSYGTELFRLPGSIVSLVADPSGRDFLALTYGHVLYRWTLGDAQPTKLADGVSAAAWLP